MSGIAELLVNLGYEVSGSDMQRTDITDRLESLGARITQGHDARNVGDAEVVVYSSAVRSTNPEMAAARERGLAVVAARGDPRRTDGAAPGYRRSGRARQDNDDLDDRPRARHGRAGSDRRHRRPCQLVRQQRQARPRQVSRRGSRRERSVFPEAVTAFRRSSRTSIMSISRRTSDFDDLKAAFVQFANGVPANGAVIMCIDDVAPARHPRRTSSAMSSRTASATTADVTALDVQMKGFGSVCTVRARRPGGRVVELGSCSSPPRARTMC